MFEKGAIASEFSIRLARFVPARIMREEDTMKKSMLFHRENPFDIRFDVFAYRVKFYPGSQFCDGNVSSGV